MVNQLNGKPSFSPDGQQSAQRDLTLEERRLNWTAWTLRRIPGLRQRLAASTACHFDRSPERTRRRVEKPASSSASGKSQLADDHYPPMAHSRPVLAWVRMFTCHSR